ncbi:hypothetical protein C5E51_34555 [Nocardia nova]|uniref:relaxase/mobilization nuclease domain-containing protein n=1 Tax=Nocardia nova TaxID=37330 RepID=UPI000CE9E5F3|nr:hypothetical protein [Nocardia nova]PPJ01237.1 hypothetical protein C5E51_34555 [Nocardia nova]
MIPNITKGSDITRLMWYLAGPGRSNEHTRPRVIAGDVLTMAVFGGAIDQQRAWQLGKLLDSPRQSLLRGEPVLTTSYRQAQQLIREGMERSAAFAAATKDENTWHCSLAIGVEEGELSIEKWSKIATDFMREMGFIDRGDGVPDARWATMHHGLSKNGNDHIHIAMPIVRPDGSLADVYRDHPRAQAAARVLEERYGLRVLYSREHGDTEVATKPAERARAERVGALETDREALRRRVRGAAAAAESEAEWLRLLHEEGIIVAPYWGAGGMDEVTGYSVQLPAQRNLTTDKWERSIRYGGGRLGRDMTLAAIRSWAPWDQSASAREEALAEWRRITVGSGARSKAVDPRSEKEAIEELRQWSDMVSRIPVTDRAGWAQVASQTSGLFAAASARTERKPGPLDRLSRQLARAGRIPARERRRYTGTEKENIRSVARMLWAASNPEAAGLALIYALTELMMTVQASLDTAGRAAAAAAMASQARKALTEIHMRRDGIDPDQPYDKTEGSSAWAAAMRSAAVVDGHDCGDIENQIRIARAQRATRPAPGKSTGPQQPSPKRPQRGPQQRRDRGRDGGIDR